MTEKNEIHELSEDSVSNVFSNQHGSSDSSAVILKVTKLDDRGTPNEVKWKYDEARQVHGPVSHNAQGYGVVVTVLFIVGEMVGGGIISMPNAVYEQGWAGVAILVILASMSGFTGVQLGKVWIILQERWPEIYLKPTQNPYPEMGYRAGGVCCRRLVSFCLNVSLLGIAVVFLIIIATNVQELLKRWANTDISFCLFILIVGCILLPTTYLGSPKDFWQVSFLAAGSTIVAIIVMIVGMSLEYKDNKGQVDYPSPTFVSFVLGYGTMAFTYSGQSAFPTIQHDIKLPNQFSKAIIGSYLILFLYYIPVCVLGYLVYGDKLGGKGIQNVLQLLPPGWCQDIVILLITLHVFFGFIIFINPVNQELESVCGILSNFTWKRLISQTAIEAFVIFVAESVPTMNLVLDLVGGTASGALAFIFPGWFYLKLRWNTKTYVSKADMPIQKWEYPLTAFIVLIGVLGALASVYAFISTVADGGALFKKPCYVNGGN